VKEMINFASQSNFVHNSNGFLTCLKNLRHGADGFTSPPKEDVLRIFIAIKNGSFSAGIDTANVGSNGKTASHDTTEDDKGLYPFETDRTPAWPRSCKGLHWAPCRANPPHRG
jgi:hypothetical protein